MGFLEVAIKVVLTKINLNKKQTQQHISLTSCFLGTHILLAAVKRLFFNFKPFIAT
jgi:hypothetical protein